MVGYGARQNDFVVWPQTGIEQPMNLKAAMSSHFRKVVVQSLASPADSRSVNNAAFKCAFLHNLGVTSNHVDASFTTSLAHTHHDLFKVVN